MNQGEEVIGETIFGKWVHSSGEASVLVLDGVNVEPAEELVTVTAIAYGNFSETNTASGENQLIGDSDTDPLENGSGNNTPIEWSHSHKNSKVSKKKTIPCASWVQQFVGDLATKDETSNPNGKIKVELPTNKPRSRFRWGR